VRLCEVELDQNANFILSDFDLREETEEQTMKKDFTEQSKATVSCMPRSKYYHKLPYVSCSANRL